MHLDKQHPIPVYLQLKELLQHQIEQGVYLAHQQLPSERDLCQHHNLSRMTARRALQELIADGFAYTRAGKGTFVSNNLSSKKNLVSVQTRKELANNNGLVSANNRQKLITSLLSFDCVGTEQVIREVLATYTLETIACSLFPETIRNLEQQWQNGKVSLLVHNYAITVLHSQLVAMVNATPMPKNGPKVLLACAPDDHHDIGLLLMALNLRRRGVLVIYLGPNLAADELHHVIDTARPQVICLSAATEQAVDRITSLSHKFANKLRTKPGDFTTGDQRPIFTYGGVAFSQNPLFVSGTPGFYLGKTIENAVIKVQELLDGRKKEQRI